VQLKLWKKDLAFVWNIGSINNITKKSKYPFKSTGTRTRLHMNPTYRKFIPHATMGSNATLVLAWISLQILRGVPSKQCPYDTVGWLRPFHIGIILERECVKTPQSIFLAWLVLAKCRSGRYQKCYFFLSLPNLDTNNLLTTKYSFKIFKRHS